MQYANLGTSGLKVSNIILGCMSFAEAAPEQGIFSSGWVMNEEDSMKALHHAYFDLGIHTFDTANVYTQGQSERVVGKFLKKYSIPREHVVILTKACFPTEGLPHELAATVRNNTKGLSRKNLFASLESSLERLGVDYVDLFQIHRFDPETPVDETMEALHDLVKSGKVRYIGASSMYLYQFAKMQYTAELRGWTKFVSMQNLWNLLYREEEREMVPFCKEQGIALIPYSPLASGALTRPASVETFDTKRVYVNTKYIDPENASRNAVRKAVEEVAARNSTTNAVVSIAWLLYKGALPIIGATRKPEQLDDVVKALNLKLSPEDIKALESGYLSQEPCELAK